MSCIILKLSFINKTSFLSLMLVIVTIVPIFVVTCDLESLVASGHKKIWRPPAANMGFCDFKDVVAFGNNQLWRPLTAKVKDHHSGLPKKMVSLRMHLFVITLFEVKDGYS